MPMAQEISRNIHNFYMYQVAQWNAFPSKIIWWFSISFVIIKWDSNELKPQCWLYFLPFVFYINSKAIWMCMFYFDCSAQTGLHENKDFKNMVLVYLRIGIFILSTAIALFTNSNQNTLFISASVSYRLRAVELYWTLDSTVLMKYSIFCNVYLYQSKMTCVYYLRPALKEKIKFWAITSKNWDV